MLKSLLRAAEVIFTILHKLWDDCAMYEAGLEAALWEMGMEEKRWRIWKDTVAYSPCWIPHPLRVFKIHLVSQKSMYSESDSLIQCLLTLVCAVHHTRS